jgi:hypothetical protein
VLTPDLALDPLGHAEAVEIGHLHQLAMIVGVYSHLELLDLFGPHASLTLYGHTIDCMVKCPYTQVLNGGKKYGPENALSYI